MCAVVWGGCCFLKPPPLPPHPPPRGRRSPEMCGEAAEGGKEEEKRWRSVGGEGEKERGRYSTLCYSSSSSSFIWSAAISATFVTDLRSLCVCVCVLPWFIPLIAVQEEAEGRRGMGFWRERRKEGARVGDGQIAPGSCLPCRQRRKVEAGSGGGRRALWLPRSLQGSRGTPRAGPGGAAPGAALPPRPPRGCVPHLPAPGRYF